LEVHRAGCTCSGEHEDWLFLALGEAWWDINDGTEGILRNIKRGVARDGIVKGLGQGHWMVNILI
jgi:hypothetical protein